MHDGDFSPIYEHINLKNLNRYLHGQNLLGIIVNRGDGLETH